MILATYKEIMLHSYTCPHNCETCKSPFPFLNQWRNDMCPVCGSSKGDSLYACNACWNVMKHDLRNDLMQRIHNLSYKS